jgi:hypothetical protein
LKSNGVSSRKVLIASISTSLAAIFFSAAFHSGGFNAPYSDILSFWQRSWVASGQVPYSPGTFLEYPPVSGLVLYASRIVGGSIAGVVGSIYAGYYDSFSVLSLFAAVAIAWSTWRLAGDLGVRLNPIYFLLPSMLVYGVYNFDLFNALFIVLCLQFFVEKRRGWSASFMGLAIATKLVAGVLLPIFLLELVSWKDRTRYVAVSLVVAAAFFVPIAIYNFGYFSQFLSYYSSWGLEDAWYIWIFGDQFSMAAKIFGVILMAVLLVRVYTLKMPLVQRSFLALSAYLLSTTIFAPQFTVMLIPLVAVLALNSPWLYCMEVFNALIIFSWFSVPDPTHVGTAPQAIALVRSASLALLTLSVAAASGHSFLGWFRARLGSQKTLDGFLGTGTTKVSAKVD